MNNQISNFNQRIKTFVSPTNDSYTRLKHDNNLKKFLDIAIQAISEDAELAEPVAYFLMGKSDGKNLPYHLQPLPKLTSADQDSLNKLLKTGNSFLNFMSCFPTTDHSKTTAKLQELRHNLFYFDNTQPEVTEEYDSDEEKIEPSQEQIEQIAADVKLLKEFSKFNTVLESLPPQKEHTVIHGTNLFSVVLAAQLTEGHLLGGNERSLASPFTAATGESYGETPLNKKYVSTIRSIKDCEPVRYGRVDKNTQQSPLIPLDDCKNYAQKAARRRENPNRPVHQRFIDSGFRTKTCHFHKSNSDIEGKRLKPSFFKTTYKHLSEIETVVKGHPCGSLKNVSSSIQGEVGCERVLITEAFVASEKLTQAREIFNQAGINHIILKPLDDLEQEAFSPSHEAMISFVNTNLTMDNASREEKIMNLQGKLYRLIYDGTAKEVKLLVQALLSSSDLNTAEKEQILATHIPNNDQIMMLNVGNCTPIEFADKLKKNASYAILYDFIKDMIQ